MLCGYDGVHEEISGVGISGDPRLATADSNIDIVFETVKRKHSA